MNQPKPAKLHDLQNKITEYTTNRPWLTLEEGEPYRWKTANWKKDKFPNADSPGVYAFLNDDDEVLYIGSSYSRSGMGHRIAARTTPGASGYLHEDRSSGGVMLHPEKQESWKANLPTCLMTWAISPDEVSYEAPALELFLIRALQPQHNTQGK